MVLKLLFMLKKNRGIIKLIIKGKKEDCFMKCLKMWILVMLMLLTVITNYPQAMLKSECLNEDNMSVEIVDKIYKSKSSKNTN